MFMRLRTDVRMNTPKCLTQHFVDHFARRAETQPVLTSDLLLTSAASVSGHACARFQSVTAVTAVTVCYG